MAICLFIARRPNALLRTQHFNCSGRAGILRSELNRGERAFDFTDAKIAVVMESFDPLSYGPVFGPLLSIDRARALDAGKPELNARSALEAMSIDSAFAHSRVVDRDMASCCISGVWLLHDFLDESHTISQSIETPSGSYWHAIMHRREGDFSNAKYWFRRVGRHAVIDLLSEPLGANYDPFAFVDRCEAAIAGRTADREKCRDIQQLEWETLFDDGYRAATGA